MCEARLLLCCSPSLSTHFFPLVSSSSWEIQLSITRGGVPNSPTCSRDPGMYLKPRWAFPHFCIQFPLYVPYSPSQHLPPHSTFHQDCYAFSTLQSLKVLKSFTLKVKRKQRGIAPSAEMERRILIGRTLLFCGCRLCACSAPESIWQPGM